MKYFFTFPAVNYFAQHLHPPEKLAPGDVVEVLLDQDQQTALFSWKTADGKSCAYPEWMDETYTLALNQVLSFFGKAAA